jgi:hypothetical protein
MHPQPIDNSAFTEEQRTEVYRREHMAQELRQTKALESIRSILIFLLVLMFIGFVAAIFIVAANARTGL